MGVNGATEVYMNTQEHFKHGYKYSLEYSEENNHYISKQIDTTDKNYFKVKFINRDSTAQFNTMTV